MKYCPYCGTPFAESETICPNCGRESAAVAPPSAQQPFASQNQAFRPSSPSNPNQSFLPPSNAGQPFVQPMPPPASYSNPENFFQAPGAYNDPTYANRPFPSSASYNNQNQPLPLSAQYNNQSGAFSPSAQYNNQNQSLPPAALYNSLNQPFAPSAQYNNQSGTFPPSVPYSNPNGAASNAGANFPAAGTTKRGISSRSVVALIVVAVIILLSVLGIAGYNGIYLPQQRQAHAQATAFAHGTSEAHSTATSVQQTAVAPTVSAQQTATAVALQAQKDQAEYNQVTSGTPALNDPLQNGNLNNWTTDQTCAFNNNAYVATTDSNGSAVCADPDANFADFAYQIHMTIIQGDAGGLLFRSSVNSNSQIYLLDIDKTGEYVLGYVTSAGTQQVVGQGTSQSFHKGLNQDNEIMIVANGSTFDLYINKHHEGKYTNNGATSGFIGVAAASNQTSTTTQVQYTNAKVWKLGQQE